MNNRSRIALPSIKAEYLLLIAGLVWLVAGGNIFKIGLKSFIIGWHKNHLYLIAAAVIYVLFIKYIFYPLIRKHTKRISFMNGETAPSYSFFDKKSYIVMLCMISIGIILRNLHILHPAIIGFLYCGIGSALMTSGILFMKRFFVSADS